MGSRARNLLNSRSNSSAIQDFFNFIIGTNGLEFFGMDCSDDDDDWREIFDFFLSFVLIVFINSRISERSIDVKLDWLWLRDMDDGDEWTVESEHRLSWLISRRWRLN